MQNKELNIFQRMVSAESEVKTVVKSLTVGYGNNSYRAVSDRDIIDAIKPIELKYGIYSYATNESKVLRNETIETTNSKGNVVKQNYFEIEITYRFVNVDNPSDFFETKSYGLGIDSSDKAHGKAMTYAGKYALMKAYKVSTGDENDAEAKQFEEEQQSRMASVFKWLQYKLKSDWNIDVLADEVTNNYILEQAHTYNQDIDFYDVRKTYNLMYVYIDTLMKLERKKLKDERMKKEAEKMKGENNA